MPPAEIGKLLKDILILNPTSYLKPSPIFMGVCGLEEKDFIPQASISRAGK
jgi:hypothetical protein